MTTETTFETASYKGIDYAIVCRSDSLYHTSWIVEVDEHDGLPCWGKSFWLPEHASKFVLACMDATDEMLLGEAGSLYFNACCIYEGL